MQDSVWQGCQVSRSRAGTLQPGGSAAPQNSAGDTTPLHAEPLLLLRGVSVLTSWGFQTK